MRLPILVDDLAGVVNDASPQWLLETAANIDVDGSSTDMGVGGLAGRESARCNIKSGSNVGGIYGWSSPSVGRKMAFRWCDGRSLVD